MHDDVSRRRFLGVAAGAIGFTMLPRAARAHAGTDRIPSNAIILFQGDSVTDNFHERTLAGANMSRALGTGYPFLAASALLRAHPDRGLSFFNRGISGNKIPDLEMRWQADTLDLKPNVVSVLIGVNDFWHTLSSGYTGTLADYERGYLALMDRTRRALPGVKLIVMEPFATAGRLVDERWYPALAGYQQAAKRVAEQSVAVFVPLQDAFDKEVARSNAQYWTMDGIHPTPAGHALIAERWQKALLRV